MRMATGAAKPREAGVGRAGPSAFVGGTGGRRTGSGSREQPGQERVFLAHGFVGNDGDLTVAWRGHKGDDTTTLKEAEDALARTTHELLNLVLRRRGRWVEYLAFAISVRRVHAGRRAVGDTSRQQCP
jgi:hypothetical protein